MDAPPRHGFGLRTAACAAVAAALALPGTAQAHLRSSTVAVDYQGSLGPPSPAMRAALTARVLQSDRALELTVRPGHVVLVLGDLGEPLLRLDRAGLAVNADSPTAAAAGLAGRRTGGVGRVDWRITRGRQSVVWHDARLQGRASGPWSIPLVVDGHRMQLRGQIRRVPPSPAWPWALAAVLAVAAAAPLAVDRSHSARLRPAASFASAAGGVAAIATATVFALGPYASPGTWIAGIDEVLFAAVGLTILSRGTGPPRTFAAIWLGLLSLAVGASKGAVFLHPIVLAAVPSTAARLAVAVDLGAGVAACLLGAACLYRDGLARMHEPEHLRRRPPAGSSTR